MQIILQNRMLKRKDEILKFLGNTKSMEEVEQMVLKDWLKAEYKGLGKEDHVLLFD